MVIYKAFCNFKHKTDTISHATITVHMAFEALDAILVYSSIVVRLSFSKK